MRLDCFAVAGGYVVVCSGAKERVYELVDDTHDEHVEVHLTWLMRAYLCW
jgi:hypothetical protein